MQLRKIIGCTNVQQNQLMNLNFELDDAETGRILYLKPLGAKEGAHTCNPFTLEKGEVVIQVKAFYSETTIRALQIKTDAGRVERWGLKTKQSQQKVWNLDYAHELIGFRGVGTLDNISSLGVIILDKKSCDI